MRLRLRETTGRRALATWLARRAPLAGQMVAVEESLLSGRFGRYAFRRLGAFILARGWGIGLHVLELTWLATVFSAKPFVASLALQNVTLVLDAALFGALEGMRRRARELGPATESAAIVSRWLTVAIWLAIAITITPILRVGWQWLEGGLAPSLFHVYAMICALRLGADVVLRTYYSGVFAHHRVYRPLWTPLVPPTLVIGVTLALWPALAGWSFPIALAASVIASRALLYHFTRSAYRLRRVCPPRWRLTLRLRGKPFDWRLLRDAVLAGIANTTTRIGGVVLLAAIVPSLARPDVFEEEASAVEPFAFALHIAAPLLFVAGQWGLVFYHDWKRLEDELAETLAAHLHGRLLATAAIVSVVAWASACALVSIWVPLEEVWPALLALFPAALGLSVWTALQLRGFARGEFIRQVASAAAMIAVIWVALSSTFLGTTTWYIALGAGPWAAIAFHAVFSRWRAAPATGEVTTLATWVRALGRTRTAVTIWEARAIDRPVRVAARIASELGDRGALVRLGRRVVWFEHVENANLGDARAAWLRAGHGALVALDGGAPPEPGDRLRAKLEASGRLAQPARAPLDALAAAHARLFPDGVVLRVGAPSPAAFLGLAPTLRQAIWRDALRGQRGIRSRSGWFVTVYAPEGATELLFAAPRPIESEHAAAWYAKLAPFGWRLGEREGSQET
ncbi:MAG: hypothetical protein KF819_15950 [Labilithrix sp.]|nr:hypothetical protein [Labilithrix sp.]